MNKEESQWLSIGQQIKQCGRLTKGPFTQQQFVQMQLAHPEMTNEWVVYSLMLDAFERRNPHGLN